MNTLQAILEVLRDYWRYSRFVLGTVIIFFAIWPFIMIGVGTSNISGGTLMLLALAPMAFALLFVAVLARQIAVGKIVDNSGNIWKTVLTIIGIAGFETAMGLYPMLMPMQAWPRLVLPLLVAVAAWAGIHWGFPGRMATAKLWMKRVVYGISFLFLVWHFLPTFTTELTDSARKFEKGGFGQFKADPWAKVDALTPSRTFGADPGKTQPLPEEEVVIGIDPTDASEGGWTAWFKKPLSQADLVADNLETLDVEVVYWDGERERWNNVSPATPITTKGRFDAIRFRNRSTTTVVVQIKYGAKAVDDLNRGIPSGPTNPDEWNAGGRR